MWPCTGLAHCLGIDWHQDKKGAPLEDLRQQWQPKELYNQLISTPIAEWGGFYQHVLAEVALYAYAQQPGPDKPVKSWTKAKLLTWLKAWSLCKARYVSAEPLIVFRMPYRR